MKKEIEMKIISNRPWISIKGDIVNVGIAVDFFIWKNLAEELILAKENNIEYTNLNDVVLFCYEHSLNCYNNFSEGKYIPRRKKIKDFSNKNNFIKQSKKTYLIKDLNNNLYKIGYSNNPELRESTLQSEKPNIKMVKVWDTFIEKELHEKYKDQRIRGEWFKLTPTQVKYICTHY